MANPGTAAVVSPQQPQTTVEPPGGPFVRHSEPGKRRIYDLTAQAFGGLINQPLKAIPGYVSKFRFEVIATGGVNGNSSNVQATSDAPESCVSLITVRDALGTPIVSGPGYEILRLVPMFSGGFGLGNMFDTHNLPSYSGITGGTQSTSIGSFTFSTAIPFEFGKAYGVIGMADASELPDVSIQLAASSAVFTTAPPTVPTMEWKLGADFYWLPQGEDVEPPGLGSTRQWFLKQGNPSIPSASTETILLPRQGGWLDTLIFELRDSNNARVDGWPTIIRIYIDGIGIIDSTLDEFKDDMSIVWGYGGGFTRPTGVLCWCRKTSLNQINLGFLDTYETAQSPLALDTLVRTTKGWSIMGDLAPGDEVFASDGLPTKVLAVSEVFTGRRCFDLHFADDTITADGAHRWAIRDAFGTESVKTTQEMFDDGGVFAVPTPNGEWQKISSIEERASVPTRCISVGTSDHLFQVGRSGVLTHNTSPGTSIEFEGAPWGTISNSPGVLNVVEGLVIPSGSLLMGLEEV